ncbi:site-specific DNA-methyltransferase, partial [Candidatus Woesearchaeota archaeon CG_4_10_14_0_2_um_filter_33_13]
SDLLFLNQPYKNKINGEDNGKTVLGWYLNKYITKNTSDYFIHKDLKGFLLRELDFYIKNEMFNIDKVEDEDELRFNLRKIRTFKSISKKIIEFLAQIEEFQKRLWEKKKFVVSTDYCITLDYIDEKNYPEVLKNSLQIEEWKRLGFVEGKVDVKFLKENSTLNIDTKFFDVDFKYQILSEIEDLEENTNGVLINSENFQALNLMLEKYREKIKCCYIDPPYNTVHSEILYKNNFKHSSWLSLLNNSVPLSKEFLMPISSFGFAIDDYELHNALLYLNQEFCDYEISVIIVNHHPQGSGGKLSRTHEYYIVCSTKKFSPLLGKEKERYEEDRSFMRSGTGENNYRIGRWRSFYALLYDPKTNKIIDAEEPVPLGNIIPKEDKNCLRRIYPINSREEERVWRSSYETGKKRAQNGELFLSQRGAVYQALVHDEKREVLFSNWMDSKFNAGQHGSALLSSLGLGDKFDYPKSINTMELGITAQTELDKSASILDFFAGSGTTGHAVLKLNKEDEGNRKFILVEMGEYFDTVTKPRIQKVIFSDNWKNGKPQDNNGSKKQIIKYQSLEQYEDTLNNIDFSNPSQETLKVKDYKIKYMLNIESRDNNVFMNLENLENPFNYKLIINGKETTIDLVETFNYLAGLKVSKISKQTHKKTDYIIVRGKRKNKDVVVFWRNIKDLNKTEDKAFIESQINDENEIFVNSDSLVRNAKPVDLILKEELFGGI